MDQLEATLPADMDEEDKQQHRDYPEMLGGRYVKIAAGTWRQVDNPGCYHDAKLLLVQFSGEDHIA